MGKYQAYNRRAQVKGPERPHPVWRGIGCLIMIIVPVISYALATLTVDYGLENGWPIPYQIVGTPQLPGFVWSVSVLNPLFFFIQSQTNLYAYLAIALLYAIALGGVLSFGYALLYRVVGPPRYSPLDAPPPGGIRLKRYKR